MSLGLRVATQWGILAVGSWWSVTMTSMWRRTSFFDLGGGSDAAVDGDDELAFVGDGVLEGVEDDALFEGVAVGDVVEDVGADEAEELGEEGGGGDPVDVVIAVDEDVLFVFEGFEDAVDGFVHIGEELGVEEVGEFGVEIAMNFFEGFKTPGREDMRRHRMDAEFFDDGLVPFWVDLRVDPDGIVVRQCHEHSLCGSNFYRDWGQSL